MTSILIAVAMGVNAGQTADTPEVNTSDYFYGQSCWKVLAYRRTTGEKQDTYRIAVTKFSRHAGFKMVRVGSKLKYQRVPAQRGFALHVVNSKTQYLLRYSFSMFGWQHYAVQKEGFLQKCFNGEHMNPVLVLPQHVRNGETWKNTFEYGRKKANATHNVLAINKSVTVPAGTYKSIVVQSRLVFSNGKKLTMTKYYGKGVGLVKEVVDGDAPSVRELQSIKSFSEVLNKQKPKQSDAR